ncbi:hypothetical protein P4O66_004537 [Electrophorus voltai]|uniref:Reverse transcriptase domain-containing protein n=1 Tax=Electrophorus voltai TaxID=2609070 RepID=A0AAD9E245_9TELE|nr:hypothetical protein P4O66_004537 [Electrophorus voltai]
MTAHHLKLNPSKTELLFIPDPRWPSEILRENKGCDARKRPRGKRAGVRNRLRARTHRVLLPSILLANVQSLDNKLDDFQARIKAQSVRVGNCVSSTLTLSTGAPQGCVLSPLVYSLYTYDCVAISSSTTIVKFADDTVIMGLILYNDKRAYLVEIKHLENWCQENNLLLYVSKTKEPIVDCSKKQERHYQPIKLNGTTVERVDSFRYLGVHISQELSRSHHTNSLAKKARQRLYHLR